jgi:protein TonB
MHLGEAVATGQDRTVDLRSVALVARRDISFSATSDLSNVVAFARPRRGPASEAPVPAVSPLDRAATSAPPASAAKNLALVAGSLAVHCSLLFVLWQSPPPLASIGIEAITVDVVLDGATAAGLASTPSENEAPVATPSPVDNAADQAAEPAQLATELPQDVLVAASETAPERKRRPQEEPAETDTQAALLGTPPVESPAALPPPTVPDTVEATVAPAESPPPVTAPPAPERKRIAAPTKKKAATTKQMAAAARAPSTNTAGAGGAALAANYNSRVFAHLARYKRGPGSKGAATVSFALDGGGRVTSVRLTRSSGVAGIDQEAVAVVRRASPFPAPPDGRGRNFILPIQFDLR